MRKMLLMLVALLVICSGCIDYSSGTRVGVVTKFSRKGLLFKTWEGEVNLGGFTTDGPNIWRFSLDSSLKHGEDIGSLIASIDKAQEKGKRVRLHYMQELYQAPWRGDTDHFVYKVETIQ